MQVVKAVTVFIIVLVLMLVLLPLLVLLLLFVFLLLFLLLFLFLFLLLLSLVPVLHVTASCIPQSFVAMPASSTMLRSGACRWGLDRLCASDFPDQVGDANLVARLLVVVEPLALVQLDALELGARLVAGS